MTTPLTLTETGVQLCVKRVSPLGVPKIENCLTEFSSSSWTTLSLAKALLAATSWSTGDDELLFQGTIAVGTRTTGPLCCLSSLGDFSAKAMIDGEEEEEDDAVRLRPRKGSRRSRKKALISIIRLRNARSENKAFMRPLAPEVKIKDDDASLPRSVAIWCFGLRLDLLV